LLIRMYFVACPAALSLFTAFAPQLSAFQLHAMYEIFAPHRAWAAALTSARPARDRLTQLVLSGSISWPRDGRAFMDDVVRQRRALELVHCPQGSYTDVFFRELPPAIRILELYHDVDGPFAHERALAALLRGRRKSQSALEEVRFLSQYRTTLPLLAGSGVVEAARARGVRLVCVRTGLYTPVGCMAEADIVRRVSARRCDCLGWGWS
ncbi:hypothetical protein V8D89_008011, partial [Ganoderma adspersum]